MAHRDALRELQARLAQRLQAASDPGQQAAWLAVEAGGERWLLPLAQAGEIFPFSGPHPAPHPVPYTQAWFLGVSNLRGGLWGVVDLAAFATGRPPALRAESAWAEARLVTLNPALEVNSALRVDHLSGLRGMEAFAASESPSEGSPGWFGSRYTDFHGTCWQEVNLQALSQQTQFLGIVAHDA